MQQKISIVLVAVLLSNCIALPHKQVASLKERQQVTCSIRMEKTIIARNGAVVVHVLIKNNSPEEVLITSMMAHLQVRQVANSREFYLPMRSYLSRIDVETGSALKLVKDPKAGWSYPERKLALGSKREIELTLDLAALIWSEESAPSLPFAQLYAVVANGAYDLEFTLEGRSGDDRLLVTSEKAMLEIQKQPEQTQ